MSKERLGETLTAKRDFAGALKAFEDGEAMALAMATKDPSNLDWQYDLAIGDDEIGETKMALGDVAGAIAVYRDAVRIDKALTTRDSTDVQWRTHLLERSEHARRRAGETRRASRRAGRLPRRPDGRQGGRRSRS